MSAAATIASALAALVAALLLGLFLAIWPPMIAAVSCTVALAADEFRRGLRRWRAMRTWARRISV